MVTDAETRITLSDGGSVTAIVSEPEGSPAGWRFLYAPGAGANVHDPFGKFACRWLAERGVTTIRFQFPYQEAGKRGPDRQPVLEATWRAAIEQLGSSTTGGQASSLTSGRGGGQRLVAGGRSMGGRIASMVVAAGARADALVLFAYPLHPPGKPDARRTEHMADITQPTIFISGARDAFASPEELSEAAALVRNSRVSLMDGADHGFNVPKSTGRTKQDVWQEAVDAMWEWLSGLPHVLPESPNRA